MEFSSVQHRMTTLTLSDGCDGKISEKHINVGCLMKVYFHTTVSAAGSFAVDVPWNGIPSNDVRL